jgi:hypothetical protein
MPPPEAGEVWTRLGARRPTIVAIIKPDHVRDVDAFVARYAARAFGPFLFWKDDIPKTDLEILRKMLELPFERVIISHGAPVHERAAFERALVLPPWKQ